MTEQEEWLECIANPAYEINSCYPYRLRDKETKKLVREYIGRGKYGHGYKCLKLGGKTYLKHRIVAQQFLSNPNNLPQIDHINHIRTDNRLCNLRWCSASENLKNRTGCKGSHYNYVERLPETTKPLNSYNGYVFDNLFVDYTTHKLYIWNGANYRELNNGSVIFDTEHKRCKLSYNKLFNNQ